MLRLFSFLATGVCLLLGSAVALFADETRNIAIDHYLSRLVPVEREIFGLLEREWQNAKNLDELKRAERFRSGMLGYLDRGLKDERVNPLIPRHLKSIFDSRKSIATRELQSYFNECLREAHASGDAGKESRFNAEIKALEESTPPLGLSDAVPSRFRVRPVADLGGGVWEILTSNHEHLQYSRSLSRISLGGGLYLPSGSAQRKGQLFLAAGEPRRGYLAVEFSTGNDSGKYFFGIYDRNRQVAVVSLPLEAGVLYRWRFDLENREREAAFELYDEKSRQQRLFLPWESGYELGFGTSVSAPQNPTRMMLILLPSSLP